MSYRTASYKSCRIVSCRIALHCIASRRVASRRVASRCVACHVVLCRKMQWLQVSFKVVGRRADVRTVSCLPGSDAGSWCSCGLPNLSYGEMITISPIISAIEKTLTYMKIISPEGCSTGYVKRIITTKNRRRTKRKLKSRVWFNYSW